MNVAFFFSSRRRHTRCALVTGVQTCALPISVATCRGVAYYKVPDAAGLCAERIITATIDARLLALDAITGRPCPGFGHNGAVDLRVDMGRVDPGYYFVTSAPQIVRGRIVLGGWEIGRAHV